MVFFSRRIPRMVLAVGATFGVATQVIALNTTATGARYAPSNALGAPDLREVERCDKHGDDIVCNRDGLFDLNGNFGCCNDQSDFKAAIASVEYENESNCHVEGKYCTSFSNTESSRCVTVTNVGLAQTQLRFDKCRGTRTTIYTYVKKSVVVSTLIGAPVSQPSTLLGDPIPTSRSSSMASMTTVPSRSSLTRPDKSSMSRTDDLSVSESTVSSSKSTFDSSSGTPSTLASTSEDTTPTLSDAPVASPTSTLPPDPQNPSGKKIGVIVACSVLAVCILGLLLAFSRKWYVSKRRKEKEDASGILPEPRQKSPNDERPIDTSENADGGTTRMSSISNEGGRSHEYARANGSVTPPYLSTLDPHPGNEPNALSRKSGPRTPEATELSTLPPSTRQSTVTTDHASMLSPMLSTFPNTPGRYGNPSPPFTATPTPISPLFPVAASASSGVESPLSMSMSADITAVPTPTTAGAELSKTRASQNTAVSHVSSHDTLRPSNDINEYVLKSSTMSHMAGPYLTAEKALGEGFWEAEREQLEADKAIGKTHEGATTHDKKDGGPRKRDIAGDRHVNAA